MTVARGVWNQIQSNDHRLMRRVHRWRAPRWFRILMILMTRMGDGWLWYSLGLILFFFGGEHRFLAIGAAASAAVAGNFSFPRAEENQQTQAPLRSRTAPLGGHFAARQIFVSFGPLHHRIWHRDFNRDVLPGSHGRSASRRFLDRFVAHHPRHAFPERCPGRLGHRHAARRDQLPRFRRTLRT